MNTPILLKSCLIALLTGISVPSLEAQQLRTVSAQNALEAVRMRFGMESVKWISEIKGTGGQPQPIQWDIVAYDANSPGLLHHFRASSGLVQDGGPDSRRYPNDAPNGFFNITDIGVDSVAAFTIAEAEARKARQGFDSCDYFLQLREFSRDTVWKLDLIDANHRLAGSVFISGSNGEVLRTIWIQRGTISGLPNIVDSMSPAAPGFTGITGAAPDLQNPIPNQTGIAGLPPRQQPMIDPNSPYAPVSPEGIVRKLPDQTPPKRGSIFREFPTAGGGGSTRSPVLPRTNNPLDPTPPVRTPVDPPILQTPEPEQIPMPVDPVNTGPAPPINVPNTGGSAIRIPPPPVPQ